MVNAGRGLSHGGDRGYGSVSALVVDPRDSQTVYATRVCVGVFKSTDGGHRWSPANAGLEPRCQWASALALDPSAPQNVYATSSGRGVFKSLDGGAHWQAANEGLSLSTVFSLAVDPRKPGSVYAAAGDLGLFESSDGGAHWRSLASGPELVDDVALDRANPRHVFAVAAGYGLVRSFDAGRTWRGASFSAPARGVDVVAINGKAAYAGTFGSGLFGSRDGGRSWHEVGALNALGVRYVGALAVAPGDPAVVYAGSDGSLHAPGLYESTDGGSTWQLLTVAVDADVDAIALDPESPATIYLGALGGKGSVLKSTDGGASWQRADAGLPRLWVKTDTGKRIPQTWGVAALVIDPVHPTTLYAAVYAHGVFRSTDSGRSWQSLNAGLTVLDVRTLDLDANGRTLYAGTSGGGVVSLHLKK
jgi:photosystem II stability/assembly factor-like uncharacterized protein